MSSLFKKFFDHEISRRDVGTKLLALGFSQIAVNTFLGAAAEAREPLPEMGVKMSGTGADILAETLRAAGVDYIFGTSLCQFVENNDYRHDQPIHNVHDIANAFCILSIHMVHIIPHH